MTKIALDVESTLADIGTAFRDEYEKRHRQRPGEWTEWDFTDAEFDIREFMEITGHLWKHQNSDIPPTEKGLMPKVHSLYGHADRLDIVTGRQGFRQQMQAWLDAHGILYDEFRIADSQEGKVSMGYDVLIDDCPHHAASLHDNQTLYLYDQPYNQHIDERYNVVRAYSLSYALNGLK